MKQNKWGGGFRHEAEPLLIIVNENQCFAFSSVQSVSIEQSRDKALGADSFICTVRAKLFQGEQKEFSWEGLSEGKAQVILKMFTMIVMRQDRKWIITKDTFPSVDDKQEIDDLYDDALQVNIQSDISKEKRKAL